MTKPAMSEGKLAVIGGLLVALTPAGQATAEAIRTARHVEAERFFAGLDAADRTTLARILKTLNA